MVHRVIIAVGKWKVFMLCFEFFLCICHLSLRYSNIPGMSCIFLMMKMRMKVCVMTAPTVLRLVPCYRRTLSHVTTKPAAEPCSWQPSGKTVLYFGQATLRILPCCQPASAKTMSYCWQTPAKLFPIIYKPLQKVYPIVAKPLQKLYPIVIKPLQKLYPSVDKHLQKLYPTVDKHLQKLYSTVDKPLQKVWLTVDKQLWW